MVSWQFLIVGSFGAMGAAMAIGTLAALVRYRRTGLFPGQDEPSGPPSRGRVVGLWVRVAIGTVLGIAGFMSLRAADLL